MPSGNNLLVGLIAAVVVVLWVAATVVVVSVVTLAHMLQVLAHIERFIGVVKKVEVQKPWKGLSR